jgi:hypothetical protein
MSDDAFDEGAEMLREARRRGLPPSELLVVLRGWLRERELDYNTIPMVIVATRAFALTINECKHCCDHLDEPSKLDELLGPLIDARRERWDRRP